MPKIKLKRSTADLILIYLEQLCMFLPDVPCDLQDAIDDLEEKLAGDACKCPYCVAEKESGKYEGICCRDLK